MVVADIFPTGWGYPGDHDREITLWVVLAPPIAVPLAHDLTPAPGAADLAALVATDSERLE